MIANILLLLLAIVILGALFVLFRREDQTAVYETPQRRSPSASQRSASSSARRNWLVGYTAEGAVETSFHIGERTVTLGRGVGNFIQIVDTDASRVHCQFVPDPEGVIIRDKGSGNGTFVNGRKISEARLNDGDEVRVGTTQLTYRAEGDFDGNDALRLRTGGAVAQRATQIGHLGSIRDMMQDALIATRGNIEASARICEVMPETFIRMCEAEGIDLSQYTNVPPELPDSQYIE